MDKATIGEKVITPKGRLSYPFLVKKNSEGKYASDKFETILLIPKEGSDITMLKESIKRVAKEAFGDKVKSFADLAYPPIKDGDTMDDEVTKGHWVIKAKSKNKPGIVGANAEPLDDPESEVYGGAYARLSIKACSYEQGGKPGVTWILGNVQVFPGGDRFGGGGSRPEDDFGDSVKSENMDDIPF